MGSLWETTICESHDRVVSPGPNRISNDLTSGWFGLIVSPCGCFVSQVSQVKSIYQPNLSDEPLYLVYGPHLPRVEGIPSNLLVEMQLWRVQLLHNYPITSTRNPRRENRNVAGFHLLLPIKQKPSDNHELRVLAGDDRNPRRVGMAYVHAGLLEPLTHVGRASQTT